jgi:sulfur-oxidizing protein SoxY
VNTRRRLALRGIGIASAAAFAGMVIKPSLAVAAWNQSAFDANRVQDAFGALGIAEAQASNAITLGVPQIADNGGFVPVEIASRLPGTESIALFIDNNPYPYIARFDVSGRMAPFVSLRVRMAETSPVRAVVRADGKDWVVVENVRVVAGGCAGDVVSVGPPAEPGPIRMRARRVGAETDVRVLMTHPMENGLRPGPGGDVIPEHFIQHVTAQLNGETVLTAYFGRSVSTDPLIGFKLLDAQVGDRLTVRWEDSRGMTRSDEGMVSAP